MRLAEGQEAGRRTEWFRPSVGCCPAASRRGPEPPNSRSLALAVPGRPRVSHLPYPSPQLSSCHTCHTLDALCRPVFVQEGQTLQSPGRSETVTEARCVQARRPRGHIFFPDFPLQLPQTHTLNSEMGFIFELRPFLLQGARKTACLR